MYGVFDSGEKVGEPVIGNAQKSKFVELLRLNGKQDSNKILLHTGSNELTNLMLRNQHSMPQFKLAKQVNDQTKGADSGERNYTHDEYNRRLLSKNPFSLAKFNNRPAAKPKAGPVKKMNKTHTGNFVSSLRASFYKRDN